MENMKKQQMYATCVNNVHTNGLEIGEEYHVISVEKFPSFGDTSFYMLENGYFYASCHFSVTYLR